MGGYHVVEIFRNRPLNVMFMEMSNCCSTDDLQGLSILFFNFLLTSSLEWPRKVIQKDPKTTSPNTL